MRTYLIKPVQEQLIGQVQSYLLDIFRDNLFLATCSKEEHYLIQKLVSQQLRLLNVKIGSGCAGTREIRVLGFTISQNSMTLLKQNLQNIQELPRNEQV
jgi:predicted molibdopterin-dependent oxidoreductase YjgC